MLPQKGFSLVELMVTLAILAILITFAIPSFNTSLLKSSASSLADSLISSLNYTKSEAISRNQRVTMCARDPANNSCLNGAVDWNLGWVIRSADGELLRSVVIENPNAQTSLIGDNDKQVVFKSSGEVILQDAAGVESESVLTFGSQIGGCDDPQLNIRREITIALSGLITVNSRAQCQ